MQDLLSHPAVQGGALPFIVAFAVAAPLARTRWLAFGQAAGFAATVTVTIGWSLESLTSTRKLAIVAVGVLALCVLLERSRSRVVESIAIFALAASSTWVLWRLLAQKEFVPAVGAALLAAAYVAWQAVATLKVSANPARGAAVAAALGVGSGVIALMGASAVLGVAAFSAASAAAATLVVEYLFGRGLAGRSSSLPATVVCALVAPAAVLAAELPWYAPLPLLAVAPAAMFVRTDRGLWRNALAFVFALVPAVGAAALAWFRPT